MPELSLLSLSTIFFDVLGVSNRKASLPNARCPTSVGGWCFGASNIVAFAKPSNRYIRDHSASLVSVGSPSERNVTLTTAYTSPPKVFLGVNLLLSSVSISLSAFSYRIEVLGLTSTYFAVKTTYATSSWTRFGFSYLLADSSDTSFTMSSSNNISSTL